MAAVQPEPWLRALITTTTTINNNNNNNNNNNISTYLCLGLPNVLFLSLKSPHQNSAYLYLPFVPHLNTRKFFGAQIIKILTEHLMNNN
jgi:hypothetical protein